jgi:glycosyltransferase involved in cell wall biosynthesis
MAVNAGDNSEPAASATPSISIIIATRNAAAGIRACIESVINQTYPSFEILVQDALSTDATLSILKGYDTARIKVTSEADSGIYDAWNRALGRAQGNWIMFLGADDRLAHPHVLQHRIHLLSNHPGHVDLVCGRIAFVSENGTVKKQTGAAWNWPSMLKYQIVAHIGLMHHRGIFENFGRFSTRYRIVGDYDFLLRLGPDVNAIFVDEVEILAGARGVSQKQIGRVLFENFQIQRSRRDIGYALATANLLSAAAKALYRSGRELI